MRVPRRLRMRCFLHVKNVSTSRSYWLDLGGQIGFDGVQPRLPFSSSMTCTTMLFRAIRIRRIALITALPVIQGQFGVVIGKIDRSNGCNFGLVATGHARKMRLSTPSILTVCKSHPMRGVTSDAASHRVTDASVLELAP